MRKIVIYNKSIKTTRKKKGITVMYSRIRFKKYPGCKKATMLSILLGTLMCWPVRIFLSYSIISPIFELISVYFEGGSSTFAVIVFVGISLMYIVIGKSRNILEEKIAEIAKREAAKNDRENY